MRHDRRAAKSGGPLRILLILAAGAILALLISAALKGGGLYENALALQLPVHTAADEPESPPTENLNGADVDTDVGDHFRVELLSVSNTKNNTLPLAGGQPTVLIYHTHATEAYRQVEGYEYEESGDWRTHDESNNIITVGEELKRILFEEYGILALHDKTDHEPPKLSSAYSRSVITMERYREEYPTIELYIDVHRDAYGSSKSGMEDHVVINGRETARLMFVVGTGEGATGTGFPEMPDFAANYALAKRLTASLNAIDGGLTRNIRVKTGRYNQHIGRCILVEVGHNANTLPQAINAMEHLARAIAESAGIGPAPAMLPLAP